MRLPATPRIVLTDLCNVQTERKRDREFRTYSLNYKSPEAAFGTVFDQVEITVCYLGMRLPKSSDVWAAGCVLYEMICGHQLFPATNIPVRRPRDLVLRLPPFYEKLEINSSSPIRNGCPSNQNIPCFRLKMYPI